MALIKPDAYDPTTNTIYEYHGEFAHGHPSYYDPNDINPRNKTPYGVLYQNTLLREQWIRNDGYNLVVIWEKDFYIQYKDKIVELKNSKNIILEIEGYGHV